MTEAQRFCLDQVRTGDKDRFLAALFAPDHVREHLFALYAFNLEIARVRDAVSEPQLGEVRLQWWLDTLDGIGQGAPQDHPVARALSAAVAKASLPLEPLRNLVRARQFDLYSDPMPDLAALEGYLGETSSALIQLGAILLSPADAPRAAEAAGLSGVAYGLAKLLRALAHQRARQQCFVPADMLARHGLAPEDWRADPGPAAAAIVGDLVAHARRRLAEARAKRSDVSRTLLPAFLPVCLTDLYLDRVDRAGGNTVRRAVDVAPLRRQLKMWWAARRESI